MSSNKKLMMGEFFCGPGGIAKGAQLASENLKHESFLEIIPMWATDYDFDTCKTYCLNIHKTDLSKIKSVEDLPKNIYCQDIKNPIVPIKNMKKCDIFSFGFPCNDFSLVGKLEGLTGKYGPLYSYAVEYLKCHQPSYFLAENVSGLSSSNESRALGKIINDLNNAGYNTYTHLYKFEEYGLPQARHRIIIIGIRDDLTNMMEYLPPQITHGPGLKPYKSAKNALTIPPISSEIKNQEKTNQSKNVIERLKLIAPGENAWCDAVENSPYRLNVHGAKLSSIYKRLDSTKPSYTVTGSGGGGTHIYHWEEHRALTNRERARLQTFPDEYVFIGSKESVRKQIGMAVPPEGAKIIFEALIKTIAKIPYKGIKCSFDIGKQLKFKETGINPERDVWTQALWNPKIPNQGELTWQALRLHINHILQREGVDEDRQLDAFFLTQEELSDPDQLLNHIVNKVIGYLRDDVMRYEPERLFAQGASGRALSFAQLRQAVIKDKRGLLTLFSEPHPSSMAEVLSLVDHYRTPAQDTAPAAAPQEP